MSKTKPTYLKRSEHQRESHALAWNRYAGNQVLECVDPAGRQGTGRETVASGMVVPSSAMDLGLHPCLLSQALSNCFSCFAIVLAWNLQLCQPSHCLSVCLTVPACLGLAHFYYWPRVIFSVLEKPSTCGYFWFPAISIAILFSASLLEVLYIISDMDLLNI